MNKIRIIDLLNKIANGEEVPKKIKFYGKYYIWYDNRYTGNKGYCLEPLKSDSNSFLEINTVYDLNYEVEILEEEPRDIEMCGGLFTKSEYDKLAHSEEEKKTPEKLNIEQDTPNSNYYIRNENGTKCALTKHSKMIVETLNQVIDYLKSKGDE